MNTTTEAKVKVAINGFGRIGASRSLQSEPFSLRLSSVCHSRVGFPETQLLRRSTSPRRRAIDDSFAVASRPVDRWSLSPRRIASPGPFPSPSPIPSLTVSSPDRLSSDRPQLPPLLARPRRVRPRGCRHQRLRRCQAGVPPRQVRLHPRHLRCRRQGCRRHPHLHRRQGHRDCLLPRPPPAPLEEARRAARD